MTLGWIIAASLAGGGLSAALAALALYLRTSWIPMLVSFAIGTLLGAAFLEVIPHAFDQGDAHEAALAILGGIFARARHAIYREHCMDSSGRRKMRAWVTGARRRCRRQQTKPSAPPPR